MAKVQAVPVKLKPGCMFLRQKDINVDHDMELPNGGGTSDTDHPRR
jgi:hypothetical protein